MSEEKYERVLPEYVYDVPRARCGPCGKRLEAVEFDTHWQDCEKHPARKENERLREALERIARLSDAEMFNPRNQGYAAGVFHDVAILADAALRGGK